MSTTTDIVSEFITKTCNSNLQPNYNTLLQWRYNALDDYNTVAGSVSELHIDPMLPCVRDTDVMSTSLTALAMPSRLQVQLHLPAMFEDAVHVYEIADAEFPGYVYLLLVGRLSKRLDTKTYELELVEVKKPEYLQHQHIAIKIASDQRTHGPAIVRQSDILNFKGVLCTRCLRQAAYHQHSAATGVASLRISDEETSGLSKSTAVYSCDCQDIDIVLCVRCLEWPTQASNWTKRARKYNWPDASTIHLIHSNGCDLVEVAHHQCRGDEWKRTHQWRLSFSRAETVLLNTWTPIQQIVYHIIRFVLHESGVTSMRDDNGCKILSRYHLKTLMMWTCELKCSSWWQCTTVVQLSADIMQKLINWCESSEWEGYFVTASNILECKVSQSVIKQLTAFTEGEHLACWLVKNYIHKCAEQYLKDTIDDTRLEDVKSTRFQDMMSSLAKHKQSGSLLNSFINTGKAVIFINEVFSNPTSLMDGQAAEKYYKELGQVDHRLQPLFIATLCLKQMNTDDILSEHVTNLLSAFLTEFDEKLKTAEKENSAIGMLHKAIRLLQISVKQSAVNCTSSSILFVLSLVSLRRLKDVMKYDIDGIHCLADVYLAVSYHIAGRYRQAVRHCKNVIRKRDSSCVIGGFTLPKINDDVDNAMGLAVLYQYIRERSPTYLPSLRPNANTLSIRLFACYLIFLANLASVRLKNNLRHFCMRQYKLYFLHASKMIATDFLLFYMTIRKCPTTDRDVSCIKTFGSLSLKFCATELRRLLFQLSVEQMTVFRRFIFCDYQSVCETVTSDVEAMYAYLCDQYERCLRISQENVRCLLRQTYYFPIPIVGRMTYLMNDDVACLAALSQLNHLDTMKKYATIAQQILSLYLVVETKLKLCHPFTSLVEEMHRVKELYSQLPTKRVCDRLLLSFIYRKAFVKLTRRASS
jgi:hypothetical protein